MEKYLIINCGSSSLKFSLYDMPKNKEIVNGYVEKIGNKDSFYTLNVGGNKLKRSILINNHQEAVDIMLYELLKNNLIDDLNDIKGVGHRVLHGGEYYSNSVLIDEESLDNIKGLSKLGPLHLPAEISAIMYIKEKLPLTKQVAVFDTAFHQTMPEVNYLYPVPYDWYKDNNVRKYGFHGTSHKYITETMQEILGKNDVNLIICHIGSGASISCIKDGICYDTSMGLTPLDGLMMGTRCGSIDPSILEYICKERNISINEATSILNKQSGLLGIAGKNDFRDCEKMASSGDKMATLAIEMLQNSIIKYIAQYYFELEGKVDSIVFTAGIGENGIKFREDIINKVSKTMKIYVDKDINNITSKNSKFQSNKITTENSSFDVFVIPTNEEYEILKDTYEIINNFDNVKKRVRRI